MDGFYKFLVNNQWLGLLAYVVIKEVWPFIRDKVWPRKIAEQYEERERLKKMDERAAQIEERHARAIESMGLSVQQMSLGITTNNERISQLITDHAEHARFTQDAVFNIIRGRAARSVLVKAKRKV